MGRTVPNNTVLYPQAPESNPTASAGFTLDIINSAEYRDLVTGCR